jgi:CobQ-like glutamine amidotransferase family enzyme
VPEPAGLASTAGGRPLRVCALYPDLMNIYADRGNLIVLERRCSWPGSASS